MMMKRKLLDPKNRTIILICLSFLLTSTGWLSWEYHLMDQINNRNVDFITMVLGYLLQAGGTGIYSLLLKNGKMTTGSVFSAALILHLICMVPSIGSPYLIATIIFGFLMNIFCGIIAGYYLHELAIRIDTQNKATVFGTGYGISILFSYFLSLLNNGSIYHSENILIVCLVLTLVIFFIRNNIVTEEPQRQLPYQRDKILLFSIMIILFGIVNNCGFAFPTSDLQGKVNLELSRLVYALGLIIAGFITDKERKYGAICALIALMIPFIVLALKGETTSAIIFWILSYFTFGFYSIYRIILFSDLSRNSYLYLSGYGLLMGRIGDAIGETLCLALSDRLPLQILVTALFFAVSVLVFFKVYSLLYIPELAAGSNEKEHFFRFALEHDLSNREQDVLKLILDKKTNTEIADILMISDNTAKFHIKNILQKTGYKNRNELTSAYFSNTGK